MNRTNTIEGLLLRLQTQAQGTDNADDPTNLADFIWMSEHHRIFPNTEQVWNELVQDFETLNVMLNVESLDKCLTRQLLYAISGLITRCIDYAASHQHNEVSRRQLLGLGWRIATAWDAVLAGDIESISEHVKLEEIV